MNEDKINHFINANPRVCLYSLVISCALIWQTIPGLIGVGFYFLLIKKYQLPRIFIILAGLVIISYAMYYDQIDNKSDFNHFIKFGFLVNRFFWLKFVAGKWLQSAFIFYHYILKYALSLPLAISGILGLIDLIPQPAHADALNAIKKGILHTGEKELSDQKINTLLARIPNHAHDGTLLGISTFTGKSIIIPDKYINQVALVLGTTGSGKTITLRRFYQRAIEKGYPLIIVDGKPTDDNVNWLVNLAEKHKRKFYGFNCANFQNYDPLTEGGYTELKDKIISLKDQWESDYYRSIAEDYLQTTFEILLKSNKVFDLKKVVSCLNYEKLQGLVRELKNEELSKRVENLEQYDRSDITGLQAHLNILVHSELGQYFQNDSSAFRLKHVIENGGVAYFALPALRFPSFSKVLGKLVINDLKAVIDRHEDEHRKIFTIFDEVSVFAGEQILNLVNMGRGKGVHAILGTQGLADLEKVDATFKSQVLNCVNTMIFHRLNDDQSAEAISGWIGTKDNFTVTAQLNLQESDAALGSVRVNKDFIVHPDSIKRGLNTGEAFYVTKVGGFKNEKIRIKFS